MVSLVDVGGGALALTHRPKLRDVPALRAAGATHLITLLAANEQAEQIGKAAEAAGLTWIWVPMVGAGIPDAERSATLRGELDKVRDLVASGARVVVHCSAGIHRTGMVGYALLRLLGLSRDEAREKLGALRQVTAEGVGDDRLGWGDSLVP
jgi:protein-tyrosine phosphatase